MAAGCSSNVIGDNIYSLYGNVKYWHLHKDNYSSLMNITLLVNDTTHSLDVEPGAKLLWVIREKLKLMGTKYGCGVGSCGACMVHVDGVSSYACQLLAASLEGRAITTIEGLAKDAMHPVQLAWLEEEVPQCGYCQSGQIMRASHLLAINASPTREEITSFMSTNLCRCGTYPRIVKAIESASSKLGGDHE